MEKSVSSYRREPFLTSKRRPLHLQTIVFTPLSIRRGAGGEAIFSPLLSRMHLLSLPTEFSEVNAYDLHTMETLVSVFIANLLEISR